jgi:K+-transporting ATPase ATPase B chain
VIVVAAMAPVAVYLDARINVADLIALLVALIPTTIGALLSAIGIAGIDRTMRFNVLAMSGKAIEAAGDVHTLILDKTGPITVGNRQATGFIPLEGIRASELVQAAYLASFFDTTPEGRTIVTFAQKQGADRAELPDRARPLDFSAETRISGLDSPTAASFVKAPSMPWRTISWKRSALWNRRTSEWFRTTSQGEGRHPWRCPSTGMSWA